MELLNRQLSAVASSPANPQSDRERLQVLAISIAERYRTLGHTQVKSHVSQTFHLLLDIMQFFDLYHSGHSDTALQVCVCVRVCSSPNYDHIKLASSPLCCIRC